MSLQDLRYGLRLLWKRPGFAESFAPCVPAWTALGDNRRNPIVLVRQRGGRRSIPRVLSVHHIRLVLGEVTEPYRTMVLIAACLGLRASEIIGLQWGDFNWETSRCW
jgi:integrase